MNTSYKFRNHKSWVKILAKTLLFTLAWQVLFPIGAYALTGGPTTPEVQTFKQIGQTGMVDPFTGDFSYNIPLLDVGGYPVNLIYNAGVSMDQEASWVGLGWNLNVGAITRNMRGIPDDFQGDEIKYEQSIKPKETFGLAIGYDLESVGLGPNHIKQLSNGMGAQIGVGRSFGINYSNYQGIGYETYINSSISTSKSSRISGLASLGLGIDSQKGASVSSSASFGTKLTNESNDQHTLGTGIKASVNSRSGLQYFSVSANYGYKRDGFSGYISRDGYGGGGSLGGIAFQADPSYIPFTQFPFVSKDITLSLKVGKELKYFTLGENTRGYYTKQSLAYKEIQRPAFGSVYHEFAAEGLGSVKDFNREKDGEIYPASPSLPLAQRTFDVYQVSGHGTGGIFRPVRGDAGVVNDPYKWTTGKSGNISTEVAMGNDWKVGRLFNLTSNEGESGKWKIQNNGQEYLEAQKYNAGFPKYEAATFKFIGESDEFDNDFFNSIGGESPVRLGISSNTHNSWADNTLRTTSANSGTGLIMSQPIQRESRKPRTQNISTLTAKESLTAAQQKSIEIGLLESGNITGSQPFDRYYPNQGNHHVKPHHFSQFSVTDGGGGRFVYGLPAYNLKQKDVTFSIEENIGNYDQTCPQGLVGYDNTGDNSIDNHQGRDQYFSSTELPPYAYAWHLTSYVSSDYEDISQDGPTPDDIGNYVLFNYSKIKDDYNWRAPFSNLGNEAKYDYGFMTDDFDDKGNYSYGEKEVYYVNSIETRDYVAEFEVSERLDAVEAVDENGGMGNNSLYKLDRIRLYSKTEKDEFGQAAVPLKTISFTYDYSLCQGLPNSNGATGNDGKLSLLEVSFAYRNSQKGNLNPYTFTYSTFNPNYNQMANDRWGNYVPPVTTCNDLDNTQWPYAEQNRNLADQYASAWNLKQIELPSGGAIEVEYEADDYGYVQDKKVMRMFKLSGISDNSEDPNADQNDHLFIKKNPNGPDEQTTLYFDLEEPIPSTVSNPDAYIREQYFRNINPNLYFKCLVDITGLGDYEYIPGYAEIDTDAQGKLQVGVDINQTNGFFTRGVIKLKEVPIGDREDSNKMVNPIAKATWQMARLHLPRLVYPGYETSSTKPINKKVTGLAAMTMDMVILFKGFNRTLRNKEFGQIIDLNKSWIRLQDPNHTKLGGGHRVKSVKVYDNWNNMAPGESEAIYGQEYYYTKAEYLRIDLNEDGKNDTLEVSSGVSSYEPLIGGDENPFRIPIEFVEINKLAQDNRYYVEEPLGESLMPYPVVGYSKVTVRNLQYQDVKRNATGYTISEFYTARDFPTLFSNTGISMIRKKGLYSPPLFSAKYVDNLTASEGYLIERNDMHGKPKANWVYPEPENYSFATPSQSPLKGLNLRSRLEKPLSGVEYIYKTRIKNGKLTLDNQVTVIESDGSAHEAQMGTAVDFITDLRESRQKTTGVGFGVNVELSTPPGFPVPSIWPSLVDQTITLRTASSTKLIDRFGIIDQVIVHDRGARIPSKTLAFDAETGSALVTQTVDEFHQPMYSLNIPAWWAYDRMGHAYKNDGMLIEAFEIGMSNLSYTQGKVSLNPQYPVEDYFVKGDEVMLLGLQDDWMGPYWITELTGSSNDLYLVDAGGHLPGGTMSFKGIKVIRSGRRNLLGASISSMKTGKNPLEYDVNGNVTGIDFSNIQYHTINAAAIEYSENWQMYCGNERGATGLITSNKVSGICYMNELFDFLNSLLLKGKLYTFQNGQSPVSETLDFTNYPDYLTSGLYSAVHQNHPNPPIPPAFNNHCWSAKLIQGLPNSSILGSISDCVTGDPLCTIILDLQPATDNQGNVTCDFPILTNLNSITYSGPGNPDFTIDASCPSFINTSIEVTTSCFDPTPCANGNGGPGTPTTDPFEFCAYGTDSIINPYLHGILGHWRPKRSYTYLEDRSYLQATTSVRDDGYLNDFLPYWDYDPSKNLWQANSANDDRWQFSAEVTKVNERGLEIEEVDPLGHYSAALTGYANSLVTAAGSNARIRQLAFDGFEDYGLRDDEEDCRETHLDFVEFRDFIDNQVAHTGKSSLKVDADASPIVRDIALTPCVPSLASLPEHQIRECDCQELFAPDAGQKYVVSAWVRSIENVNPLNSTNFTAPSITLGFLDATKTSLANHPPVTITATGFVVEGWQKIEGSFEIPAVAEFLQLKLARSYSTAWFDDLRIHPYDGNMVSYVYDPLTRRLMAQLDENNFASFYEYDAEGSLIRLKKETVEGIYTLQENRGNLRK